MGAPNFIEAAQLSFRTRRKLRALVVEMGGASEQDAAVLIGIVGRIASIERTRGENAALDAVEKVREILLTEDRPARSH